MPQPVSSKKTPDPDATNVWKPALEPEELDLGESVKRPSTGGRRASVSRIPAARGRVQTLRPTPPPAVSATKLMGALPAPDPWSAATIANPSANDTILSAVPPTLVLQALSEEAAEAVLPAHSSPVAHPVHADLPTLPVRRPFGLPIHIDTMKLNKLVVSSYKVMGFAVLATILLGLGSFIFINIFYMLNRSWVTPMIISPTDPRVLQLNAQYASDRAARDSVMTQQLQLKANLADVRRVQASEEQFQRSFEDVMQLEAADHDASLQQFQSLLGDLQRTRGELRATSHAYTKVSKDALQQEMAAGLIDKDQATRGGLELSQIAGANLALHEKHVELDSRIAELRRTVSSMKGGKTSSYEVLHMQHEYEQSKLASQKAAGDADAVGKSVAMLDQAIANYDVQLARIEKAPYLQAADRSVTTAFIPYDNVDGVKAGDAVYSCALSVFWCHKVGVVAEVLDGEVVEKHPLHNRELRGILARLTIADVTAMQHPVLHLGHAPVGI